MEYFDFWYSLFVPWDDYNTIWVALILIIYLNKLNTKYIVSEKSYGSILHTKD
mgnify:CR=1 FL=1